MINFFYWDKENKFDEMINEYSSVGVNWFVHCFHPWESNFDTYNQLVKNPPWNYIDSIFLLSELN